MYDAINLGRKSSIDAVYSMQAEAPTRSFIATDFIDDRQLAARLNISMKTPAQWRHLGKFTDVLPFYRFGRCVRYRREDVDAFIEMMRSVNECEDGE